MWLRGLWRVRSGLPAPARSGLRRAVDPLLAPVGSLRSVRTARPILALTFDDGPDPHHTGPVLDVLAAHGVRATFFVLADAAAAHPGLLRRLVAEGHELGLHGLDHRRLTRLPAPEVARWLDQGRARVEDLAGVAVERFRPPSGAQSLRTYAAARRAGLEVVVWSHDAADWVEAPPERIARRLINRVGPGSIVLLHDGLRADPGDEIEPTRFDRARMVDLVLRGLGDRGLRAAPIDHLLAVGRPQRTAWFRP